MKTRQLAKTNKQFVVNLKFICLLLMFTPLLLLIHQTPSSLTQPFTVTPSLTPTNVIYTPSPTWTPTLSPSPIPTLTVPLTERSPITITNANQIGKFRSWQVTGDGFTSLSFSPDNAYLISTGNASEQTEAVRFWNIQGQDVTSTENLLEDFPRTASAVNARFSSDGQRFIAMVGMIGIWDVQNRELIGRFYQDGASMATFAGDNTSVLVAGGYQVALWNIAADIPTPNETTPSTADLDFDPFGVLITALQTSEAVIDVAFDPISYQGFILTESGRLYRYSNPEMRGTITVIPQEPQPDAPQPIYSSGNRLALDTTNYRAAYAGSHNDVIVYDYLNNQTLARFPLDVPVNCITYNSTGELLVIGDWAVESVLHIVSTATWETIAQINTGEILSRCAFSPDGTLIATGSSEGALVLWGIPSSSANGG